MKTLIAILVSFILMTANVMAVIIPTGYPNPKDSWGGIQDPMEEQPPERPWPWLSDLLGYYYIDPITGVDLNRPYGNQLEPRKTIPTSLGPGSYVELHGIYSEEAFINCSGTDGAWIANMSGPVWIVSDPASGQATLANRLTIYGSYAYVRWIAMDKNPPNVGGINITLLSDHIVIEHCNMRGAQENGISVGVDSSISYVLSYNNIAYTADVPALMGITGKVRMDGWVNGIYEFNVNPPVPTDGGPPVIDPNPPPYPPMLLRVVE